MGRDYTTLHAAALLLQLPEGSRVARAMDPDAAWTLDRALMASVVNSLNWLVWSKAKDGQRDRNRPRPVGPRQHQEKQGQGKRSIRGLSMEPDELMAELGRMHGEEAASG